MLSLSRHVRSGDCSADLPTALFALKVLTGTRFQISRRRCIPPYAGSNGAESDGGKDRHRKWACAMCLAFNVRQDGRSLALDPLDPARRAGRGFQGGEAPLAYLTLRSKGIVGYSVYIRNSVYKLLTGIEIDIIYLINIKRRVFANEKKSFAEG